MNKTAVKNSGVQPQPDMARLCQFCNPLIIPGYDGIPETDHDEHVGGDERQRLGEHPAQPLWGSELDKKSASNVAPKPAKV